MQRHSPDQADEGTALDTPDMPTDLLPCSLAELIAALGCVCIVGLLFAGIT